MTKRLPKYVQLKKELLQWVQTGKLRPDEQMPSEHEITQLFQMSRQTVRQALGELETEGVLYRIQGKGTFVAHPSSPEDKSIRAVGMLTTYISGYIFPHIVRGAEGKLRERGYQLLLSSTDNDKAKEQESLSLLIQQPLSGLIIEPTKSAQTNLNLNFYLTLSNLNIPYVMINERYPEIHCPVVKVDDELGGFLAVEHLIKLGHRRIAGFFKTDDLQGVNRLKGFIRAHQQYRIAVNPEWLVHYATEDLHTHVPAAANRLLQAEANRPTALVCYNDELAMKLQETFKPLHLNMPEHISVVGFDDSPIASAMGLTTVSHPKAELGEKAAELLLDLIEKRSKAEDFVFQPELIVRSSTAPAADPPA
ncbi:GntR family transcriptional regulator [Paenibacillus gorillae]|uniref:GntR family transcriptional regulator n=1 Tax=Paenibacillus gorillae TaxID=1243662 RepID=UPI0004AC7323|nr:GntR family transcriptional regulator [Paenibacillus gorillae]